MKKISDLQIGKAGEYLVCADLILNNHIAFPSEQGLPFDIIFEFEGKLLKVQVKTTRGFKKISQRANPIPAFIFHIGNNGKRNRRKSYLSSQVDLFALVDLSTKTIAYLPFQDIRTTMNFRVPEFRGNYYDEQGVKIKKQVLLLKEQGFSAKDIAEKLFLKISNVYKYSANVSIEQKGGNGGIYFDTLTLDKCLRKMKLIK